MKPGLLLLHGALGSKEQFAPLERLLASGFEATSINFSGHGGNNLPDDGFSIARFANDVLQWLDERGQEKTDIFGYSMGGYVALFLARHHPTRVGRIFTLATKFAWSESIAEKEIKMLNARKIEEKVPAFAAALAKRHAPQDWKQILKHSADMILRMGADVPLKEKDFLAIHHPVVVSVGDNDNMVTRDETVDVSRLLRNSRFLVLEDTEHPIEKADPGLLVHEISTFFS